MKNLTGKALVETIIEFGAITAQEVYDVLYNDQSNLRKVLETFGLPKDKKYDENDADFKEVDRAIDEAGVYLNKVVDNLTKVVNELDDDGVFKLMSDPYIYLGGRLDKYLDGEIGLDEHTRRLVAAKALSFADYPDCL